MFTMLYFLIILCFNLDIGEFEKINDPKTTNLADDPSVSESRGGDDPVPSDESLWNPKGVTLSDEPAEWPGHLKPFGSTGKSKNISSHKKYPKPAVFFKKYVAPSTPLLMKNASTVNIAYRGFIEDNFFKKWPQSRFHWFATSPSKNISFYQFINRYKKNKLVFQDEVPFFLSDHVTIPSPLLCKTVVKEFSNNMLYVGGKDQKNAIEQRKVDSIRCVYSGKQDIVLVSHSEYGSKMPKDYKQVNVDAVDYEKFPDLREVEYIKATLGRGDCIYLPSNWYWQVNTYSSSKSVDIMWYHRVTGVDSSQCVQQTDEPVMGDFNFAELKSWAYVKRHIAIYYFASYLAVSDSYDMEELSLALDNDVRVFQNVTSWTDEYDEITKEVFETLDINKDGFFSLGDLDAITPKVAEEIYGPLVDRIADYEEVMRDQQLDLKEQQDMKKIKASEIIKPGDDPKIAVENYINNYMMVLEDVINESMGEMVNTGTAPDFKEKMEKRQKEIDGEIPFKRRARKQSGRGSKAKRGPKAKSKPMSEEEMLAEEEKMVREQVKAYLENMKKEEDKKQAESEKPEKEKEKEITSDSEVKESEFSEGETYTVVDDNVEEEILADEEEEVIMKETKPKKSKSKKGKKKIKEEL